MVTRSTPARFGSGRHVLADFGVFVSQIGVSPVDRLSVTMYRALGIVSAAFLFGAVPFTRPAAQSPRAPHGPYARIAIMRARDGHSVDWEAGYIRHLEWHRQAKDPFGWYSYSVWA